MCNFATSTENGRAANELYSGPKSRMVPIHDSMAGYNGSVPKPSDNIISAAQRQGYPNIRAAEENQPSLLEI